MHILGSGSLLRMQLNHRRKQPRPLFLQGTARSDSVPQNPHGLSSESPRCGSFERPVP